MRMLQRYDRLDSETQNDILEGIMAFICWVLVLAPYALLVEVTIDLWNTPTAWLWVLCVGLTVNATSAMFVFTRSVFRTVKRSIRIARWAFNQ